MPLGSRPTGVTCAHVNLFPPVLHSPSPRRFRLRETNLPCLARSIALAESFDFACTSRHSFAITYTAVHLRQSAVTSFLFCVGLNLQPNMPWTSRWLAIAAIAVAFATVGATGSQLNVFGEPLRLCDRRRVRAARFSATGYRRTNYCGTDNLDFGSHYVCTLLPEGTDDETGDTYSPFWTTTGQAKSPTEATTWPKPGPWCICMWAYARMYDETIGSFDQQLACGATNMAVIDNYRLHVPGERSALASVCRRCGLNTTTTSPEAAAKCDAALDGAAQQR